MATEKPFNRTIWLTVGVVFGVCCLALLGWLLDIPFLKSIKAHWISMRIVTALGLICSAAALLLAHCGQGVRLRQRLCLGLGILVGLVGFLSIIAYSGQVHWEQEMGWTYAPLLRELFSPPARMAPLTALLFIGFGSAFVLLASSTPRRDAVSHALALPLAIMSYMVLVGYLFHEDELHTWLNVAVAFNTGIAFVALSIGLFCVRPQTWFMRVFTSRGVGGLIARRLLPAVVIAPLLIGWLCFTAEGAGVLRRPFETTVAVIANGVLVLLVLWFTARSANETDQQRRRTQDALRESEERYRNLFVTMAEGFALHELICDAEGRPADYRFLEVNPAFERLTGLHASEVLGRTVLEVMPGIEPIWIDRYGKVVLTGESDQFVSWNEVLGRWYEVRASRSEPGRFAVVFLDITHRRQAEEALRESQQDLNRAQAVAHIGSWRLNVRRNELLWSDETHRIFGTPTGTPLTYETFLAAIHPEDRESVDGKWQAALRGDQYDLEHRIMVGEHIKWVREKAELEFDHEGELLGAFGTVQDITGRKGMEIELRRARDELELRVQERTEELAKALEDSETYSAKLEMLNQELQEFAFVASHDLAEPLRKIQAFGARLRTKCEKSLGEEGCDYLLRMESAANRMSALLSGLLTYSRVATRVKPFSPIELSGVAEDVLSDLEILIEDLGAKVEVGSIPGIEADPDQMRQLLQNLVGNALKYSRKGEKPMVKIYGHEVDEAVRISVEDNGIGFDEKYLDRIFKPFQRLHGRSSEYEGTGMGLAICRKIVERHGGTITARSTPGRGSTFIVTLPAKQTVEKSPVRPSSVAPQR